MPHLERKMSYSRNFVQREATSFATMKYNTQMWRSSICRTGQGGAEKLHREKLSDFMEQKRNFSDLTQQWLAYASLFKPKWVWRYAVKGWYNGFTRSSETQVPTAFPLFHLGLWNSFSRSQNVRSTSTSWLPSAWRQNTESKIWTGGTSCLSPLGGFLATSSISPCVCITVPAGWVTWPSLVTGSLGRWVSLDAIASPKQKRPLLVKKKKKIAKSTLGIN